MCLVSECCGAPEWLDETNLCRDCKEWSEFYDDEEEEENQ